MKSVKMAEVDLLAAQQALSDLVERLKSSLANDLPTLAEAFPERENVGLSHHAFKLVEVEWPSRIPLLAAKHWLSIVEDRAQIPVRPGTARRIDLPEPLARHLQLI